jgi:hypothetical protein
LDATSADISVNAIAIVALSIVCGEFESISIDFITDGKHKYDKFGEPKAGVFVAETLTVTLIIALFLLICPS